MQPIANEEKYQKIWRIILAGYPNHTAEELEVDDYTYAYQATKTAIYHILGGTNIDNYYGVDETGNRTVALMHRLVAEAENGTKTYREPLAKISKFGDIELNGDEYIQNYKVTANHKVTSYNVEIEGFPAGTKVTNSVGTEMVQFNGEEILQIRIPKNVVETSDINGRIKVNVEAKSHPIFYGKTYDEKLQNYAIVTKETEMVDSSIDLNLKGNTASLKIKKVDKDTNEPIEGTVYELTDSRGKVIGNGTTDKQGNLIFHDLYQETYVLKEVKSNDNYIITQDTIDIRTEYNKVTEITLTNEHKKGNLKIHKVDKENHKIALGNVEFELYSEEQNKVIGTYRTDVNGEIFIENLRTGNYKIIEKTTNQWYNLAEDLEIQINENETTDFTIENELKKGQIRVIKVDKDNNEIKLANVIFEVLDKDGKLLETIKTDAKGEAYTKKYPIRDYETIVLKEKETLEEYSLNKNLQTIILKENEIINIQIENEVKKGQIKVIKRDKDNHEIRLPNVKFEIYDENNHFVQTLITNENGEGITERLRIDKKYTIKEVETNKEYVLNKELVTVELKENEIKELTFENEKKKGQIQILKVDSENNEIFIPDVTFEIYNSKNEKVDTIITNREGRAFSKKLPIDEEYKIKETISNKEYKITDEIKKVILEENQITDVIFENTRKYGKLTINKISNKYSKILNLPENSPIANTKFLITNSKGESIGIYTTNEEGNITIEKLPYGEYMVYEYEVPEHFLRDAEPQIISITEDGQEIELTFKNTPKEPELPKTGS